MKKNPYYRLKYIADVPYLLTFGQGNADFCRNLRLNETGAFLWKQMDKVGDAKELVTLCAAHFQCEPKEYPALAKSISHFINDLYYRGILLPEQTDSPADTQSHPRLLPPSGKAPVTGNTAPPLSTSSCQTLRIAGLYLRLFCPEEVLTPELLSFTYDGAVPENAVVQEIYQCHDAQPGITNGTPLLHTKSLTVSDETKGYALHFSDFRQITGAYISRDGQIATLCFRKTARDKHTLREEFSYALRICFFYFAGRHGKLAIHSSSILYCGKLWLFSAPSGIGKSTHAGLWEKHVGTPVINGDLNLVSMEATGPIVHGTPWCGTSGIYDACSYPLGGVVFLAQNMENAVNTLTDDEKQLRLLHRCISPSWTPKLQDENIRIFETFYDRILICSLSCNMEKDAVIRIKSTFDEYVRKH